MTTEFFASVNGLRATSAFAQIPFAGRWFVDLELESETAPTGAAVVQLGTLQLVGTVAPSFTGAFAQRSRCRVVGGAGGWGRAVAPKAYHSDAGVRTDLVLGDLAREVGETLVLEADTSRVGIDFVRPAFPAARVLDLVVGSRGWWVDYDGTTRIGARAQVEVVVDPELLDFDPTRKMATLAPESLAAVGVGSVLRSRLSQPLVVRELSITAESKSVRVRAWGRELAT